MVSAHSWVPSCNMLRLKSCVTRNRNSTCTRCYTSKLQHYNKVLEKCSAKRLFTLMATGLASESANGSDSNCSQLTVQIKKNLKLEARDVLPKINCTQAAERTEKWHFCPWWPWLSNSSERGTKEVFHVKLAQIRSVVPEIFHTQTKKPQTDSTKNRTFHSSLHVVTMANMHYDSLRYNTQLSKTLNKVTTR